MTEQELKRTAMEMLDRAYVPYSHFPVGAALECEDGAVFTGCNIENAAFGPTICAERVAVFKAVYDGKRDFAGLAVAGGRAGEAVTGLFPPCGVCRQVLREFCGLDFPLYLAKENGAFETHSLGELLPFSFSNADMS